MPLSKRVIDRFYLIITIMHVCIYVVFYIRTHIAYDI